jgi:hypothetical protein
MLTLNKLWRTMNFRGLINPYRYCIDAPDNKDTTKLMIDEDFRVDPAVSVDFFNELIVSISFVTYGRDMSIEAPYN